MRKETVNNKKYETGGANAPPVSYFEGILENFNLSYSTIKLILPV